MMNRQRCGAYIQQTVTQPLKMKEIMPFVATWMDLEIIILSKLEKDKYHRIALS